MRGLRTYHKCHDSDDSDAISRKIYISNPQMEKLLSQFKTCVSSVGACYF